MTLTKRIIAGAFAAVFCLGMASCGSTDKDSSGSDAAASDSKAEAQAIELDDTQKQTVGALADQLPEIELQKKAIKFIGHWDINPGDGQVVPPYLQLFKDKYQGEVEWVETTWDSRYDDIITHVLSKDSPDFFSAMDSDGFPKGALKGIFQPVDDYIDFSSDLWNDEAVQNAVNMFTFNGKHYVAATGSSPNLICIYNTKTIKDNGMEDPAQLYKDGNWNWAKFKEMCEKFTAIGDDYYGLDGWWYEQGIANTVGVPLVGLDESGKAVSNMDNGDVAKAQNFLTELEQAKVYFPRESNGGNPRGSGATGEGMAEGKTLFYPCGFWGIENTPESTALWGDVKAGDIMFVPMPRPDDGYPYWVDARLDNGYFLIKNAPNPEGFAAFMACLKVAASDPSAKQVATDQLKNSYGWNDEMINMKQEILDLCAANPVFDFKDGVSNEVSDLMNKIKVATMNGSEAMEWNDVVSEYNDKVNYELKKANEQIPEV